MSGRFGTTPPAVVQVGRCRGEVLLLSAFETLPSTSPAIIDAMTLSMPVEGNDEAAALRKLALELAAEYDMYADITINDDHVIVRLTRQSLTDFLRRHSHDADWLTPDSRPLRGCSCGYQTAWTLHGPRVHRGAYMAVPCATSH
jgi:hypothetical protein